MTVDINILVMRLLILSANQFDPSPKVLHGLQEGGRVVLNGQINLMDGAKVALAR